MHKVARLIEERDMEGVSEQLEAYWLGRDEEQYSVRALTEWFNVRVLEAELDGIGDSDLAEDSEHVYRLLTGDDVSERARSATTARLERQGIDVEELRRSFVSHQSVYLYLTEERGVTHPSP